MGLWTNPESVGSRFQFLGIPPKGERGVSRYDPNFGEYCFQFLGIPPKGELYKEGKMNLTTSNFVSNF